MLFKVHIEVVEINLSKFKCFHKITNETIFVLSKLAQTLYCLQHRQHTCQFRHCFHITKQSTISGNNRVSRKILIHFHNNKLIFIYQPFKRGQHYNPLCSNVSQIFKPFDSITSANLVHSKCIFKD